MSEAAAEFTFNIDDINGSVKMTNSLLRAVNSVRLSIRDIQDLMKKPDIPKFFWTMIQLTRTYSSLKRLLKMLTLSTNTASGMFGMGAIQEPDVGGGVFDLDSTDMNFMPMEVSVEAFRENIPMGLDSLDLSMIPEESMAAVQRILEEDAPLTVEDAQRILASRIMYPERSTGDLSASIGWMPQVFGTRVYASMPYAWWVEEGQRTFTGHHYLRDAAEEARMRLPDKIRAELNRIINKGD